MNNLLKDLKRNPRGPKKQEGPKIKRIYNRVTPTIKAIFNGDPKPARKKYNTKNNCAVLSQELKTLLPQQKPVEKIISTNSNDLNPELIEFLGMNEPNKILNNKSNANEIGDDFDELIKTSFVNKVKNKTNQNHTNETIDVNVSKINDQQNFEKNIEDNVNNKSCSSNDLDTWFGEDENNKTSDNIANMSKKEDSTTMTASTRVLRSRTSQRKLV